MKKKLFASLSMGLLLLAISNFANAATLYQQNINSTLSGHYSNIGGQITADDFSLLTDASINGINWYGYFDSEPASLSSISFDIGFHSDDGNKPNFSHDYFQSLSPIITDSGYTAINGNKIYQFEAALLASFAVDSGERIWLSLADNDPSTSQFLWSRSSMSGTFAYRNTNPSFISDWSTAYNWGDFSFELIGETAPVPIPATVLLFGTGLAGLAGTRLRKKKK